MGWVADTQKEGERHCLKNLRGRCRDELGRVMGHQGIKTGLNETKITAQVFIQHHGALQPHTTISRMTRAPLRSHTTHTDCHWA